MRIASVFNMEAMLLFLLDRFYNKLIQWDIGA
jgi:hypothetical protein